MIIRCRVWMVMEGMLFYDLIRYSCTDKEKAALAKYESRLSQHSGELHNSRMRKRNKNVTVISEHSPINLSAKISANLKLFKTILNNSAANDRQQTKAKTNQFETTELVYLVDPKKLYSIMYNLDSQETVSFWSRPLDLKGCITHVLCFHGQPVPAHSSNHADRCSQMKI
jgi:hypothetical protein